MPDIKQELTKLGFVPAKQINPYFKNKTAIEDAVQGSRIICESGEVIFIEKTYPYGTEFGSRQLFIPKNFGTFRKIIRQESIPDNPEKYIYIDTETTGLSGGTGTLPFLIGCGFFTSSGFTVQQLLIDSPINEITQLLEFNKILENFETTITFNGKSFDLPLIKTRYLINKIKPPLEDLDHIDLLHISRNIWKRRLVDRSLQELETTILEFSRSDDEIPGWMIPQVYFDFLRSGDPAGLKGIVYHNRIDIFAMAILHQKIISMLDDIVSREKFNILDMYSIGVIFHNKKKYLDALSVFEKCIDYPHLNNGLIVDLHLRIAQIYKRLNKWDSAIMHWIQGADLGSMESCIELAKYYEHIIKSKDDAIIWSTKARNITLNPSKISAPKQMNITAINKRIDRLNRRK